MQLIQMARGDYHLLPAQPACVRSESSEQITFSGKEYINKYIIDLYLKEWEIMPPLRPTSLVGI